MLLINNSSVVEVDEDNVDCFYVSDSVYKRLPQDPELVTALLSCLKISDRVFIKRLGVEGKSAGIFGKNVIEPCLTELGYEDVSSKRRLVEYE